LLVVAVAEVESAVVVVLVVTEPMLLGLLLVAGHQRKVQ
jgi:hypothetical protein